MIECRSMGIEGMMIKLADQNSEDTRLKLLVDIYKELLLNDIELLSVWFSVFTWSLCLSLGF
ncbi:unnamed protein product [Arabidopsis halleri]